MILRLEGSMIGSLVMLLIEEFYVSLLAFFFRLLFVLITDLPITASMKLFYFTWP